MTEKVEGTQTPRNLITVMVLSITLADLVLNKTMPKGKLGPGQGEKIVKAIEKAVYKNFPDIAPMILGLFGIEMMTIMPIINDPNKIIGELTKEYSGMMPDVNSCAQPNMV